MESVDYKRNIGNTLVSYAQSKGYDCIGVWNDWLDWCCRLLDIRGLFEEGCAEDENPFRTRMFRFKSDNQTFFKCFTMWSEWSARDCKVNGFFDAFGDIYESSFQTGSKASANGQFFTPMSVCDVMAKICGLNSGDNGDVVIHNDPACGSGRTVIASYNACYRFGRNLFACGDVDGTSVKMCALNFVMNGMCGWVSCEDALSRVWRYGYIVNACKIPFYNALSCLEYFDDKQKFLRRIENMKELAKDWDIYDYGKIKETDAVGTVEDDCVTSKDSCFVQGELGI